MPTKLFCGLDFDNAEDAWKLYQKVKPVNPYFKIGLELFCNAGPDFVRKLTDDGAELFLDLKFDDIPNTVAGAVKAVMGLGAGWINLHCTGGEAMIRAARESIDAANISRKPKLLGVTVLTSLDQNDLGNMGVQRALEEQVVYLASNGKDWGLDGVVCSAHDLSNLYAKVDSDFISVVPGIRLPNDSLADQKRVTSPDQASKDGAHFIVMSRSIINAADPAAVTKQVLDLL